MTDEPLKIVTTVGRTADPTLRKTLEDLEPGERAGRLRSLATKGLAFEQMMEGLPHLLLTLYPQGVHPSVGAGTLQQTKPAASAEKRRRAFSPGGLEDE